MERVVKAGEFKAKCLELVEEVASTGEPVTVTKHGKPMAKITSVRKKRRDAFGFMKGQITIIGDIISPIDVEWDVLKE